MDQAKTRREQRVKRGDTLSLPYKDLQALLPTEFSGYTAANPTGQSMKGSQADAAGETGEDVGRR